MWVSHWIHGEQRRHEDWTLGLTDIELAQTLFASCSDLCSNFLANFPSSKISRSGVFSSRFHQNDGWALKYDTKTHREMPLDIQRFLIYSLCVPPASSPAHILIQICAPGRPSTQQLCFLGLKWACPTSSRSSCPMAMVSSLCNLLTIFPKCHEHSFFTWNDLPRSVNSLRTKTLTSVFLLYLVLNTWKATLLS